MAFLIDLSQASGDKMSVDCTDIVPWGLAMANKAHRFELLIAGKAFARKPAEACGFTVGFKLVKLLRENIKKMYIRTHTT